MKVHIHANCQGAGLAWFFKHSPDADQMDIQCIQNFRVCTGEETREQERKCVEEADILFYHATKRVFPWPESVSPQPNCVLIPISVFYNGAYFLMENADTETWAPVVTVAKEHGIDRAVQFLVHEADLDYRKRWQADLLHMQFKEHEEGVAVSHRMSDWQQEGFKEQQLLTKNHPSSLTFLRWANILLNAIGKRPLGDEWELNARANPNLVQLPCEDWITPAAKKHLGLNWGATEYEIRRSEEFAKNRLTEWLKQ